MELLTQVTGGGDYGPSYAYINIDPELASTMLKAMDKVAELTASMDIFSGLHAVSVFNYNAIYLDPCNYSSGAFDECDPDAIAKMEAAIEEIVENPDNVAEAHIDVYKIPEGLEFKDWDSCEFRTDACSVEIGYDDIYFQAYPKYADEPKPFETCQISRALLEEIAGKVTA